MGVDHPQRGDHHDREEHEELQVGVADLVQGGDLVLRSEDEHDHDRDRRDDRAERVDGEAVPEV